jgi:hypothetical protein
VPEHDGGLVAVSGCAVALCALLTVAQQDHIQQGTDKRALAIFARDVDKRLTVSPESITIYPTKQAPDNGQLPRLQMEWFAGVLALDQLQALAEVTGGVSLVLAEHKPGAVAVAVVPRYQRQQVRPVALKRWRRGLLART